LKALVLLDRYKLPPLSASVGGEQLTELDYTPNLCHIHLGPAKVLFSFELINLHRWLTHPKKLSYLHYFLAQLQANDLDDPKSPEYLSFNNITFLL
jgi:hypothetical protein